MSLKVCLIVREELLSRKREWVEIKRSERGDGHGRLRVELWE